MDEIEYLEMIYNRYQNMINQVNKEITKLEKENKPNKLIKERQKKQSLIQEKKYIAYIKKNIQQQCFHPLWYFIENATNPKNQIPRWKCKCVKCQKISIQNVKLLYGKVIIRYEDTILGQSSIADYNEVRQEYQNQIKKLPEEKIVKIMRYKYNQTIIK